METRPLGRTGQSSSVAILGGFAFTEAPQDRVDRAMQEVIAAGVNHIDVAPTYGQAERRLGPWLARERNRFFLGCKTMERDRDGAAAEMSRSLERLQVGVLDLYQLHAVTSRRELDEATQSGGALEMLSQAKAQGFVRHIGITSHGSEAPEVLLEALDRFEFETVMFPFNAIQLTDARYRELAERLLERCRERSVGVLAIKALARGEWGDLEQARNTWYRPFEDPADIQTAVDFTLSHGVTGLCTVGDVDLLPRVLKACRGTRQLSQAELEEVLERSRRFKPLFAPGG